MRLIVNGRHETRTETCSVAALVAEITDAHRGVAVAVNGSVVPRSTWGQVDLADGDAVEVLTAAQGG